ncbi:YidC family membrane integrase SpoIIIJ [Sporolactobacillus sp. CPB3-1]|uniref:Membrane protein insertase YidC n=1 Tax=Sporolactobacillus mangiferae TaxID=2940498 RepID=A0ABT0MD70_9BACL|nr:YidC family membrane integrase SpoIIIJ [Sporolactobacillus mangiferae]MCL1632209.1 YidC family membrane integrase SpoIIIJ [Sporolactobacillus mangiferae]
MRKKVVAVSMLILLTALLAGCSNLNEPINAQSTGVWSRWFVYPLSEFIIFVAKTLWNSYGLSIIVTTIIVRLVLMPLMAKQVKSSQAMQELQPKIKELQQKYSSKDQNTQKKLQEEQMKLFQENHVNPLAGCLPILIQMPILFAFYQAIMRTEEIKTQSFLWFQLGNADPFYILPIIAAATTFLQQKIMMGRMGNSNPQMAMMLYVFPIMIAIPALYFPSALALYWVVGNIFMIFQTYIIYEKREDNGVKQPAGGAKKK